MTKIQRVLAVLLALGMIFCMCACGNSGNGDEISVSTTDSTVCTTLADEKTDPTEVTTEATEDTSKTVYQVSVVDEAGAPISGVMLQMCLETCVPGKTNDSGVAEFSLEEADYKVSLLNMPEGYDYATEEQEWYFQAGETTMTITLKSAA